MGPIGKNMTKGKHHRLERRRMRRRERNRDVGTHSKMLGQICRRGYGSGLPDGTTNDNFLKTESWGSDE